MCEARWIIHQDQIEQVQIIASFTTVELAQIGEVGSICGELVTVRSNVNWKSAINRIRQYPEIHVIAPRSCELGLLPDSMLSQPFLLSCWFCAALAVITNIHLGSVLNLM